MFKTLSAALVAASLIASPVLAQGNAPATPPAAGKVEAAKPAVVKVEKAKRHSMKVMKHRKHFVHVRHFRRDVAKVHAKRIAKHHAAKPVRVN